MNTPPKKYLSHVLTITGQSGVGTSTTMKSLEQALGPAWNYASAGAWMRQKASALGMSIEAFAAFNRENPGRGYDRMCDEAMAAYGRQNYTVIEGRLPHFFAPHSFHVLLTCDYRIRAERRSLHPDFARFDVSDIADQLRKRDRDDETRYAELYGQGLFARELFDVHIDTIYPQEQMAEFILDRHEEWTDRRSAEGTLADSI